MREAPCVPVILEDTETQRTENLPKITATKLPAGFEPGQEAARAYLPFPEAGCLLKMTNEAHLGQREVRIHLRHL